MISAERFPPMVLKEVRHSSMYFFVFQLTIMIERSVTISFEATSDSGVVREAVII